MPWTCFICRCVLVIFHIVQHENFMLLWNCTRLNEYHIRQLLWKQGQVTGELSVRELTTISESPRMVMYGYLMFFAAKSLSDESELLMEILGSGFVAGLILPILNWCSSWCHACSRCTLISYCLYFLNWLLIFFDTTNIYIYIYINN